MSEMNAEEPFFSPFGASTVCLGVPRVLVHVASIRRRLLLGVLVIISDELPVPDIVFIGPF